MLHDLGGERILDIATGDEICGQEQAFREWAPEVFKSACDTFCLDTVNSLNVAAKAMKREKLTDDMLRFEPAKSADLEESLSRYHNKKAKTCHAKGKAINLHEVTSDADRSTVLIKIMTNNVSLVKFQKFHSIQSLNLLHAIFLILYDLKPIK
jgi:nitric-oxide synthase, brain